MVTVIFRGFIIAFFALLARQASGLAALEITQAGPRQATTIRAVGPKGYYTGFDALIDGRPFACVRFTSFGLVTSVRATAARDGERSTLCFENFRTEPNCGLTLERSRIKIQLIAGQFPIVRFTFGIKSFDAARWHRTLGQTPLHFLTLTLPGATQWHQGGFLFPMNPIPDTQNSKPFSDSLALADSPLPVIGLWSPKTGRYAAWDFLPTRLRDNSERDIRTAFCREALPPPAPSDLPPPPRDRSPDTARKTCPSAARHAASAAETRPALPHG